MQDNIGPRSPSIAETRSFVDNEGVSDPVLTSNIASNTPKHPQTPPSGVPRGPPGAIPVQGLDLSAPSSRAISRQYGVRGVLMSVSGMRKALYTGPYKAFLHAQSRQFDQLEGAAAGLLGCCRPQKGL